MTPQAARSGSDHHAQGGAAAAISGQRSVLERVDLPLRSITHQNLRAAKLLRLISPPLSQLEFPTRNGGRPCGELAAAHAVAIAIGVLANAAVSVDRSESQPDACRPGHRGRASVHDAALEIRPALLVCSPSSAPPVTAIGGGYSRQADSVSRRQATLCYGR